MVTDGRLEHTHKHTDTQTDRTAQLTHPPVP
jgi:hypothetical protein